LQYSALSQYIEILCDKATLGPITEEYKKTLYSYINK
jgi:hypothetical protein